MIEKICDIILKKMKKEMPDITEEQGEAILYGLQLLMGEAPKMILLFAISFVFGFGLEMIFAYFAIMPYRTASGGFHLHTHLGCILGSIIFYYGNVILSRFLVLGILEKYILVALSLIFGILMVSLYAPADTENVPIISKKERKTKKILSYITLIITLGASLIIQNQVYSNILIIGSIIQSISISRIAYKITTTGELVGRKLAAKLNIPFGVIDLSLAPTPAVGDSVAGIFQAMGLEHAGAHGTTAALAMLNDAVKKGGIMASSHVGGLSGAFIPVSEDAGMIEATSKGYLTFDKLEAMTSVCSVGLDMIAIPGNTPVETIAGIIADEMAIGMINKKTTAVRIIPVVGKNIGDEVIYGGLLGQAPVIAVNKLSSKNFIQRGGRIPAPIHSLNN